MTPDEELDSEKRWLENMLGEVATALSCRTKIEKWGSDFDDSIGLRIILNGKRMAPRYFDRDRLSDASNGYNREIAEGLRKALRRWLSQALRG